jgi:hypothetical protein
MPKKVDWKILNSYGPYSMAVWRNSDGISIGNQESMDGRAEIMHETLRKSILKNFSVTQLSDLSILDVGCHDGWLLNELSDLPFKSMTGLEPREKNVNKGKIVREQLGIKNNIEYIVGDLSTLDGRQFDIVVCTGVLYHVESIIEFLRQLNNICGMFLFIESRTIDSNLINKKLLEQSEVVDLPYKFDQLSVGLSMHKFESTYSDGSAHKDIVVSLPTPETIVMYLQSLNFENICIELTPSDFRASLKRKDRPLDGICISAVPKKNITSKIMNLRKKSSELLEAIYLSTSMPPKVLDAILGATKSTRPFFPSSKKNIWKYLQPMNFQNKNIENRLISKFGLSEEQAIIFRDIKFNPLHKIQFEFAKIDFINHKFDLATAKLINLINSENGDWRAIYRAFHLLIRIGELTGNAAMIKEYENCLLLSNPQHPYFFRNENQ